VTELTLETVNVRREGAVAFVELNRPDTLNAFNAQLGRDLHATLTDIGGDSAIGAVVLTGAGRGFSSGFDLKDGGVPMLDNGRPDTGWALREVFNPVVVALREIPQPVIAAINGPAAGIGCAYALACDLVVAARSSYLLLAFVNVGLVPDGGSSLLVAARAGLTRAIEMALLGERVPAEEAERWGLVNRVVDDAELLPTATQLAQKLAAGPPEAQGEIKRLLDAAVLGRLRDQLELEAETQRQRSLGDESLEAIMAFLQKRPAQFR
jgi:2-(1,2-epoxy-1,2-dihydrophenyl)acetyl-CoA isomerase